MVPSLARVTSLLCIPYGYTVTLWCAGAWTVARHGLPGSRDVLLFAAGAVLGFVALAAFGHAGLDREVPMRLPALVVFNLLPLVAVLALLWLPQARLSRGLAFLASSFLATTIYVVGLAVAVRVLARRRTVAPHDRQSS